jgi:hypothetical protein
MPEEGSTEIQRVTGSFSPKSSSGVSGQEGNFTAILKRKREWIISR